MFLQFEALNENDEHKITEEDVFMVIMDTFNGGLHTGSSALLWAILYLTNHPEIQEKCRNEIKNIVGDARINYFRDRTHLSYLEAIINETLRLSGDVSLMIRAALKDTHFTIVIVHLRSAMMDPDFWNDPEEFRPERFLDKNGILEVPKQHFTPFGLGSRECTGGDLTKMELMLILGTLIQRFRFESLNKETPLDATKNDDGVVVRPVKYKVCATPLKK